MLEILRVTGAFGTRGALRVFSFSKNITQYKKIYDENGVEFAFRIIRFLGGVRMAASIEGVNDRNAAEALKGRIFYVKKTDLPKIAENEVYISDLIGKKARVADSDIRCEITGVENYGAGDLIEISYENEKFLVPFTKANFPDSDNEILITAEAFDGFR
ncbi:MAG: ribosome maturation factor RimM [Holosporaceae bacterium]|jgi:16S rRNA processing protein RimM|nr:ribosome maturation factor RimM [Holosporaceae bacterium]